MTPSNAFERLFGRSSNGFERGVFALPLIPPVRSKAFEPRAWGSGQGQRARVRRPAPQGRGRR